MKNPFLADNKISIKQALDLGITPKYKLSMQFLNALKLQYREALENGVQIELTVTKAQLYDWAGRIEIVSAYYNIIRSLADEDIDCFYGFKFKVIKPIKTNEIIKLDLTK